MAIKIKKEKEGKGFEWIEVHSVHEINVVKVYNKEIEKCSCQYKSNQFGRKINNQ